MNLIENKFSTTFAVAMPNLNLCYLLTYFFFSNYQINSIRSLPKNHVILFFCLKNQ